MSLGMELSSIRARYNEANAAGDREALLDLVASKMMPMLSALDRYEDILRNFSGQRWADEAMREACDGFGG